MSQALYRIYRSRSLSDVIGQEHITETIAQALQAGRINHAYLFTGPRGTGKTSVARILAHAINNLPYTDDQHLDIIEIDAASNRRIDDIRDLREKVHIAPVSAPYKVYIIDEVHMLTSESFNALLKTLEEPPAHVVFILATTEAHKLPATIISRTQRYSFRPVEQKKVSAHLRTIAKKEKIKIDDDALALIAEHGEGSFRDSISLLDQMRHVTNGAITAGDVLQTLGMAATQHIDALCKAIIEGQQAQIAQILSTLEAEGIAPIPLAQQLTQALAKQALANTHLYQLMDRLLEVPRAYHPGLKLLTSLMTYTNPPDKQRSAPALVSAPRIAVLQAPTLKKTAPSKKDTPTTIPIKELPELTLNQWHDLLMAIKKSHPPLFSVLKNAQPDYAEGTLTLKFRYQLHRKKIDDPKQKALLHEMMTATLGGSAAIMTTVDPAALPPPLTDDPTVHSVANLMGGGEIIDAKEI